jgi:HEAT repeat protein
MRYAIAVMMLGVLTQRSWSQPAADEVNEIAGRSFDEWMKDIAHKDPSKREIAIRSILGFGPQRAAEAAPLLLAELRRHTPGVPIDASVRTNITIALGAIFGSGGAKNPDPKQKDEAIALLTRMLRDSQGVVKFRAAQSLGMIGPQARSAIPTLLPLLRDFSAWEVRQAAATALGQVSFDNRIGPPAEVLTALYDRIKTDPAFQVRLASIQALAFSGPTADIGLRNGMIKVLEPITRKDEPAMQIWANLTLMNLTGKVNTENLDHIGKLLNKGDLLTRTQAAQAIGAVGAKAKDTVPALINGLTDSDPNVQGWVIWALSRMEKHGAPALPALEKIAADTKASDAIKRAARMSIDQLNKAKSGSEK